MISAETVNIKPLDNQRPRTKQPVQGRKFISQQYLYLYTSTGSLSHKQIGSSRGRRPRVTAVRPLYKLPPKDELHLTQEYEENGLYARVDRLFQNSPVKKFLGNKFFQNPSLIKIETLKKIADLLKIREKDTMKTIDLSGYEEEEEVTEYSSAEAYEEVDWDEEEDDFYEEINDEDDEDDSESEEIDDEEIVVEDAYHESEDLETDEHTEKDEDDDEATSDALLDFSRF